jgi:hypothetical protein
MQSSPSANHQGAPSSSSSRDVAVVPQDNSPNADHDQVQVQAQVQAPVQVAPPAPILPHIAPHNINPPLRLDLVLVQSAVPRLFQTVTILMDECDFTLPKSCKFMEDCLMTRGVDPDKINWRKSMSHIFGRNKNCTRSIPDHVWMWTCRKHYQRARYRNNHEFNKKLIRMVELQILRLEAWSNYNKDRGMPQDGVVVSWTLDVRRREKMRMEENRKRKSMSDDDDENENEEDEDLSAFATDGALVPQWLLDKTGGGKSTAEIQEIVARICRELEDSTLVAFPDIEILPNITGERAKPTYNRARPVPPPPRRRQPPPARRDDPSCEPRDKRQRRPDDNYDTEPGHRLAHPAHLPYRPNPGTAHYENERHGYGSQTAPMPSAWPPRFVDPPRGPYPDARAGPSHQRAFSLDTNTYNQPMSYQGYPEPAGGYTGYSQAPVQGRDYMRDPSYIASNLGQNGYWDADYYARQQQSQPQQAAYPQHEYLRTQAIPGGTPQGGPRPVSAAKHSRNLSTPPRLRPAMHGHPNDSYDSGVQTRYDPSNSYLTAQTAGPPAPAPTASMYPPPAPRFSNPNPYNGLPVPSVPTTHAGGDGGSVPRTAANAAAAAAEYYLPGSTRLPTHGGASASASAPAPAPGAGAGAEGFEPAYGPARR